MLAYKTLEAVRLVDGEEEDNALALVESLSEGRPILGLCNPQTLEYFALATWKQVEGSGETYIPLRHVDVGRV